MEITQIKQHLSITEVLQYYGVELIKNKQCLCPFHDDKIPSMQVYADSNTVYCFSGNCNKSGKAIDVIDFIMHKESITKHQAIVKAKAMVAPPAETKVFEIFTILKEQLPRSRKATNYLKTRGLLGLKEVGSNHRSGSGATAYYYKEVRDCIVFPLKNSHGQTASLYGRSMTGIKNVHYYLKNRKGLYPKYPPVETTDLILTESIIDAATLLLHGNLPKTTNVLACYGTNGFAAEHSESIRQLKNLETITIFFDGDAAGRAATAKLQTQLQQEYPKISIGIVKTPKDEDINSLWVNNESTELFTTLLKEVAIPRIENKPVANNHPLLFTIKGQVRNLGDSLKVTLQSKNQKNHNVIIQKLDLYEYTSLEKHAKQAAKALDICEDIILNHWQSYALELEKKTTPKQQEAVYTIDKVTQTKCIEYLKHPELIKRIGIAIGKTGVVGEVDNRLLLFLIAISYQSKQPLHGLIQGSSGSGKTKLLQSIYKLIPTEHYKSFTRVTESSFYNFSQDTLKHKLLCFEDMDGLKEEALLALRELQSNGKLISATTQKMESGKMQSMERIVNGPISSLSCTTKADTYEDNISRCFVIAVDESVTQTSKIITYQNQLASGKIDLQQIQKTQRFVQNCIRMLQPYEIVNPYADKIQLPQNIHKLRRLHGMYQNLVAQITYLNQYQRKKDHNGRLIAEKEDLQNACTILMESIVLKVDELHGSLRQFYECLKAHFKNKSADSTFTRFDVKKATGLGKTQMHHYLNQLVELEYLQQFGYANRGYTYKITYWDDYKAVKAKIQARLQSQIDHI
ncbi:CHC2 zinc finger domain-containing protein [Aquimarina muelleri]|uniref:CHC2 zinc finger domain-containing protein n=1 Tax=Aquimarina muelleri TaxID=279356 RepID=UPI003F68537D